MKPVSYQSMPSSVNGGHPSLSLDRVLGSSKVMYCEKCGFASMDAAVLAKHVRDHLGTQLYCFYCKHAFFSEAELNTHMKQHTSKYRFICPHCGQGYMRRLCLVKHIDRLHSKSSIQGPAKPGMMRSPHFPASSNLLIAPPADPTPPRPLVRVTVPTPRAPAVRLGKDEPRAKTLERNVSTATNGNVERSSSFNGLIQHNRALTVSLPEEVTIPAGCLVELVEVKTVNGTKELKLRLVSQQENESVIKETRTAVSQNTTLGKPLSSTSNSPDTSSSLSMGMCTVKRKQSETKTMSVERPPVVNVNVPNQFLSPVSKEKCGLKRMSQEIINLESDTVVPHKIPKTILNHVREGNGGIRGPTAPVNHKAAPPTVTPSRVVNRLNTTLHPDNTGTGVSHRTVEERKNVLSELLQTIPSRRANETINIRDVSGAVKIQPGERHLKSHIASKTIREALMLPPPMLKSISPPVSIPVVELRCPATLARKNNQKELFPIPSTQSNPSSFRTSVVSNHTTSKILSWPQEARSKETPSIACVSEPESFPVISSVFSLSQQPEHVPGPIKPLVLALRGIVMDKNNNSGVSTQDNTKVSSVAEPLNKPPTLGLCAQVATKKEPITPDLLLTKRTNETVKEEKHDLGIQLPPPKMENPISVKEEKNIPTNNDKKCPTPDSKSSSNEGTVSKMSTHTGATQTARDPPQEMAKTEQDMSSKFLTVSLKRVQVGVWKKCKKRLKLRISSYKTELPVSNLGDCTVIHPMPLKIDQLVKRPGPNQPVVVLNHPKPRVSIQGSGADTFADAGAAEVVPECQILKMRLSKVMGQKYEVMGYTVRVFP